MKKNDKILIFSIYFAVISLMIFLISIIFTKSGMETAKTIFAPKHYISFDKLEEVTVCYKSDYFFCKSNENTVYCEVVVKDKDFLELIEKAYRNKIVNDYLYFDGSIDIGKYKIIINENIELYACRSQKLCLDYNNKSLSVKFNEDIYNKMIEIIKPELEYIERR